MDETSSSQTNRLIAGMPSEVRARLDSHLQVVPLVPHTLLAESGSPLRYAYFPHTGVICLMAALHKGGAETATVGPEEFIGFEALLGGDRFIQNGLVQIGGVTSRLPIEILSSVAQDSAPLRDMLLGYMRYFMIQVLQSAACNGLLSVRERCARWLLMAQDRARTDTFLLTQEFMAITRYPAAERHRCCTTLQAAGLILQQRRDHHLRPSRPRRCGLRMLWYAP